MSNSRRHESSARTTLRKAASPRPHPCVPRPVCVLAIIRSQLGQWERAARWARHRPPCPAPQWRHPADRQAASDVALAIVYFDMYSFYVSRVFNRMLLILNNLLVIKPTLLLCIPFSKSYFHCLGVDFIESVLRWIFNWKYRFKSYFLKEMPFDIKKRLNNKHLLILYSSGSLASNEWFNLVILRFYRIMLN